MYKHSCPRCKSLYEDTDPEVYFCPPCQQARKKIAEQVDKKLEGNVTKNVKSNLQLYDEICKKTGRPFPSLNDFNKLF